MQAIAPPTGSRALIVGNGPSVDDMPPDFWAGAIADPETLVIGTNRVLCLAACQHIAWDALVIRDTYRNLWHLQDWGCRYHKELWQPCPAWKVGPAHARTAHCDEFMRQVPDWQHERVYDRNREAAVMNNVSVVVMAANWAWFQGARQIALIGVDYRGTCAARIPPYDRADIGWADQYEKPELPRGVEKCFHRAAAAVDAGGGKLVNLSPGARLRAVPCAHWRSMLPWSDE